MNHLIEALNNCSAGWSEAMLRAAWQGGAALALAWVISRTFASLPVSWRCWLWRVAYLKLLVSIFWNMFLPVALLPAPRESVTPILSAPASVRLLPTLSYHFSNGPSQASLNLESRLFLLWLLGFILCSIWIVRQRRISCHRPSACLPLDLPFLQQNCADLCHRLGMRRPPQLLRADDIAGPSLVGFLHPVVVFPDWLISETRQEQQLALAHELAHLKRKDLFWNWLPCLAQSVFFFHPLVWLASQEYRLVQEIACDELAMRATDAPPSLYGRLLLKSVTINQAERDWASAGMAGSYRTLHRRLMAMKHKAMASRRKMLLMGSIAGILIAIGIVPWRIVPRESIAASERKLADSKATNLWIKAPAIHGRVINETQKPVGGVTVYAFDAREKDWLLAVQTTKADGTFTLKHIKLKGERPLVNLFYMRGGYGIGSQPFFSLLAGKPLTLKIQRPRAIQGSIIDSVTGNPIPGAVVQARYNIGVRLPEQWEDRFATKTDNRGRFRVGGLAADWPVNITVRKAEYADYNDILFPRSGPDDPVRLILEPASELRGKVTYENTGRPAAGVEVVGQAQYRTGYRRSDPHTASAVTNPKGEFRLKGLVWGKWDVMVKLNPETSAKWASATHAVSLARGQDVKDVDMKLTRGGVLSVKTVDARTGKPVPTVSLGCDCISPSGQTTIMAGTGKDGQVRFRVPPGEAHLYISRPVDGYVIEIGPEQQRKFTVGLGQTYPVTFKLIEGAVIEGKVVDRTGKPVPGAWVMENEDPALIPETMGVPKVRSDTNGYFRMAGFPDETDVALRSRKGNFYTEGVISIRTMSGKPAEVKLTLNPPPKGKLVGRVMDKDGRPVAGAQFALFYILEDGSTVRAMDEFIYHPNRTDDDGKYEVTGIWPGMRYRIRVRKSGYEVKESEPVIGQRNQTVRVKNIILVREETPRKS